MGEHDHEAGARYAKLEERLAEFIARFDQIAKEMDDIRTQQEELIKLLKKK